MRNRPCLRTRTSRDLATAGLSTTPTCAPLRDDLETDDTACDPRGTPVTDDVGLELAPHRRHAPFRTRGGAAARRIGHVVDEDRDGANRGRVDAGGVEHTDGDRVCSFGEPRGVDWDVDRRGQLARDWHDKRHPARALVVVDRARVHPVAIHFYSDAEQAASDVAEPHGEVPLSLEWFI